MDVPLVVADGDRALPGHRRGQAAVGQLVILPRALPAFAAERGKRAFFVGRKHEALVDGDADTGRLILGPARSTGGRVEAADPALVRHGADVLVKQNRRAGDVGDPLQFGRAARFAHHRFPARGAIGQGQRQQLAARLRHVDSARADHHAGRIAQGQRRGGAQHAPLPGAGPGVEGADAVVDAAHDDDILAQHRRRQDLAARLALPQQLAGIIIGQDHALGGADGEHAARGTDAGHQIRSGLDAPDFTPRRRIQADDDAAGAGHEQAVVDQRGGKRVHAGRADRLLPRTAHGQGRLQFDQRGGLGPDVFLRKRIQ